MLNIILFGPPGSGKGTQSTMIVEKYNLKHLSTGDILRREIKNETELGLLAESYISKGRLVPDDVIIDILLQTIDSDTKSYKGIILDGFPRTLVQAEALEEMLKTRSEDISVLIEIQVDEDLLLKRLLARSEVSGRSDDNLETIHKRFEIYRSQSLPACDYYKKLNKYVAVNGVGTVDEVFNRISAVIDSHI